PYTTLFRSIERAHVVQPVGQLDQDDAHVARHGEQHLAEALRLLLLLGRERDPVQLGQAVDDVGDLGSEALVDGLLGDRGILDRVVQQRRHQGFGVELPARADLRHRDRVGDVGLAAAAELAQVRLVAEAVSLADATSILVGKVADGFRETGQRRHRVARAGARPEAILDVRTAGIRRVRVGRAGQYPLNGARAGRLYVLRG